MKPSRKPCACPRENRSPSPAISRARKAGSWCAVPLGHERSCERTNLPQRLVNDNRSSIGDVERADGPERRDSEYRIGVSCKELVGKPHALTAKKERIARPKRSVEVALLRRCAEEDPSRVG